MVAYNKSKCKIFHDSHPSSITFLFYRLIARTGGANYDNPEGERRWAICVKSATYMAYQGGESFWTLHWQNDFRFIILSKNLDEVSRSIII